jgi:multidrug transporter EmrE-like cation transporter
MKSQALKIGPLPSNRNELFQYFLSLSLNPWIWGAFVLTAIATFCWLMAMVKLPLNVAYPFMGLCFVLIMVFSRVFFDDPLTLIKMIGLGFIVLGIAVASQG